jgi:mono/diheme cytochrome c family protein
VLLFIAVAFAACSEGSQSDPSNAKQVAFGAVVYERHCASCHGARLEGQPNWRERLPSGRLPAPPHDASGHTWHHADAALFDVVKRGMGPHAPPGYESDMPAFGGTLSDEQIHAVLAFIKGRWPEGVREKQAKISAAHRAAK